MKRMIGCAALVLALGVLVHVTATGQDSGPVPSAWDVSGLVPVTATGQDSGQMPYTFRASATLTIDTTTGYAVYVDSGSGTHIGPETNFAPAFLDQNGILSGTGTVTTSNGDQIFYDAVGPLGGQLLVTITGGTGRFANVSGELTSWTYENIQISYHGPLMIIRYDSTAEGWISY